MPSYGLAEAKSIHRSEIGRKTDRKEGAGTPSIEVEFWMGDLHFRRGIDILFFLIETPFPGSSDQDRNGETDRKRIPRGSYADSIGQ